MNGSIVLSLCDRTGNMVVPWLEAGHECWIVDTQHPAGEHRDGNLVRVGADIRDWLPPLRCYRIVFAFPPCTNLAVSGAAWFKDKGLAGLIEGLELVERCRKIADWTGAPYMIENPVSTLSTYWREPDYRFNPCDFALFAPEPQAEAFTKRTCIWTGGGFVMPEFAGVEPELGSKMHLMPPGEDRADKRAETPKGFARAVYEANAEQQLSTED